jgi:hypothetical protein
MGEWLVMMTVKKRKRYLRVKRKKTRKRLNKRRERRGGNSKTRRIQVAILYD